MTLLAITMSLSLLTLIALALFVWGFGLLAFRWRGL